MWPVLAGGAVTIAVLIVQWALSLGSKDSRQRDAIAADIELWRAIPEEFEGRSDLRKQVEARIAEYSKPNEEHKSPVSVSLAERERIRRRGIAAAFGVTALGFGLFAAAAVQLSVKHDPNAPASWPFYATLAVLILLSVAVQILTFKRTRARARYVAALRRRLDRLD